jgi:hypothetical protein
MSLCKPCKAACANPPRLVPVGRWWTIRVALWDYHKRLIARALTGLTSKVHTILVRRENRLTEKGETMTPRQAQRRADELQQVIYLCTVYNPYKGEYVNYISTRVLLRAVIVTSYRPSSWRQS